MSVWGVSMMRDEEDVAYHVLRHLVDEGMDGIMVADNGSVDATFDLLHQARADFADRCQIEIIKDPELGYYQSRKMTNLAHMAGELGARWIVPFDADELWYTHVDRLAQVLRSQDGSMWVVPFTLFNHFGSGVDDESETNPFLRLNYRLQEQGALPKMAVRYRRDLVIEAGNHGAHWTDGLPDPTYGLPNPVKMAQYGLKIRHFPYRTLSQFIRKARNGAQAYTATDLPTDTGAHWREYGALLERYGEDALREVYERWFWFKAPITEGLIYDPAPWCRWGEWRPPVT